MIRKLLLLVAVVVIAGGAGFFLARHVSRKGEAPRTAEPSRGPADVEQRREMPSEPATEQAKEDYDSHYAQGLVLLTDQRYEDALTEFEKAQAISNTVEVAAQVEKIRQMLGDNQEAARLVEEVESLRAAGNLEDASEKAAGGVENYWHTPSGPRLTDLKKSIDADIALQAADKKAVVDKNYQAAQDYYKQNDLRNAYIILSETVKYSDEPRVVGLYEDARSRITLYDESLNAADAYIKNPETYEDAIAGLEVAQQAWDTEEVRERLEVARRALKERRDRIAVVDFDTQGEFELPDAGSAVAELLLPCFQEKYDLVERTQLENLLQEQNLQMTDLVDPSRSAASMGKIKRVNYLVLGSLMRFGGVHVTARIVQVNSGVIDRTGRISAPTIQQVDGYLDDLAAQLILSAEEYRAYRARTAEPPPPAAGYLTPAETTVIFEGISRSDLDFIDEGMMLPEEAPASWREERFKRDLYEDIMDLGLEFMHKGQYYEASRQFEMALRIYPTDGRAMSLLSQAYRMMSYIPPPPGVPRPRIAVLDFMAFGDPGYPFAGAEVADMLSCYLSSSYDVVDRDHLFWYMRRWNVTLHQLVHSRQRLMWFGRVFGVRHVIIGYLVPSGSFDVVAKVVDTETGFVQSRVHMRVHDADELRFRMGEFAHALFLDRDDRRAWMEESERRFELFSDGRSCMRDRNFAAGMKVFAELLSILRPDRDRSYFEQTRELYDEARWEVQRSRGPRPVAIVPTDLGALLRDRREAEERAKEVRRRRERNYRATMDEGHGAIADGDYASAMRAFAAAMNLLKTDEAENGYRNAKERADAKKKLWEANEKAERRYTGHMDSGRKKLLLGRFPDAIKEFESALKVKRTDEAQAALADAQGRFDKFRRQQEAATAAEKKRREAERMEQSYNNYLGAARRQMERHDYQEALSNFARAIALKKTPEAEGGLEEARKCLAEQQQKARDAADERRRAYEAARVKKEKERPREPSRRDLTYTRLMTEGRKYMEEGDFSHAARVFAQAYGMNRTDEARAAYDEAKKKMEEAQAAQKADREKAGKVGEERRKRAEEAAVEEKRKALEAARQAKIEEDYAEAIAAGKRRMEAGQFDRAAQEFRRALRIKQTPEAQILLEQTAKAEQEWLLKQKQEKEARDERFRKEAEKRAAEAREKEEAKRRALEEQQKREAERRAEEEREKKTAQERARAEAADRAYRRYMSAGELNMRLKRFDQAMKYFKDALDVKKTGEAEAAYAGAKKNLEDALAAEKAAREKAVKGVREPPERRKDESDKAGAREADRQARMEKEYTEAIIAGKRWMQANQFDRAAREFKKAVQIKQTPEAQSLLNLANQAEQQQMLREKQQKAEAERRAREEKLKREAEKRAADEEAKRRALEERQRRERAKQPKEREDKDKRGTGVVPPASALTHAAQLQKRFADCKNAVREALRKKTDQERLAALNQVKVELGSAQAQMAVLAKQGLDPKTLKSLLGAQQDAIRALQAAEALLRKKRR